MNDLAKMKFGVLKELKNFHKFINLMEKNVKTRNSEAIQKAYIFLKTLVYMMNEGELSPEQVSLNLKLAQAFSEKNQVN